MNEDMFSDVLIDSASGSELASEPETVEIVEEAVQDHPFLTTRFEDYTVTEGLLLLLLLCMFLSFCIKLIRGGFSWL